MDTNTFSFTTRQAARILRVNQGAIRTGLRRCGHYRGITPRKIANGRYLWPRAEVLKQAGKIEPDRKTVIDLRATTPWLECRDLPYSDPAIQAFAHALLDPRADEGRLPQEFIDDLYALQDWIAAHSARLKAARPRMTAEQWTDANIAFARAIAPVVAFLDDQVLTRAVRDHSQIFDYPEICQ